MPSQILRTTLIRDAAQAADGVVGADLPVNPLSAILLTVKALNVNPSAFVTYSSLAGLLSMITNVVISYRGANIINGSLTDLAVLYGLLAKWMPSQSNRIDTDNAVRSVTVPILFGRHAYDPDECFPATRRGDLIMQLTTDVAVASADNLVIQAETIELLEATPKRFVKATTTAKVNAAAGQHEIDLPISNDILGILLHGAVVPTTTSYNASFGQVAIQVDNVETVISETNWETLHGELARKMGPWPQRPHFHSSTFTPVTTVPMTVDSDEQQETADLLDNYAYIDLDPLEDGSYALKTAGAARVNLKVTDDVGSATACRVMPVELVLLGGAAA